MRVSAHVNTEREREREREREHIIIIKLFEPLKRSLFLIQKLREWEIYKVKSINCELFWRS